MKEKGVVLVVDEVPIVRHALSRLLAKSGYGVLSATDGAQAMRLFTEQRPALVLLDMNLPDEDGLSVLRRMRQIDEKPAVVIMTGALNADTNQEALRLGALDYLVKPFGMVELNVLLQKKFSTS